MSRKPWIFERTGAEFASGRAVASGATPFIRVAALQLELPTVEIYPDISGD
jgi:hypothetical protein